MSDYTGMVRTNRFRIKSREAFEEAVKMLTGECPVISRITEKGGMLYGWIGSYSALTCCGNEFEDDCEMDCFYKKIQSDVIAEDDAMLYTEIGNESLKYLTGYCTIVTADEIRYVDLDFSGREIAREMLGNPEWETENDY